MRLSRKEINSTLKVERNRKVIVRIYAVGEIEHLGIPKK